MIVNQLLLFTVIPTFFDIAVALVVFTVLLDWTLAVVLFFIMFTYSSSSNYFIEEDNHVNPIYLVAASVIITRWRTKLRRQMNDRDVVSLPIPACFIITSYPHCPSL